VSPLYSEGSVDTSVTVRLPDNRTWVYWWDHSKEFSGKAEISRVPLDEYPVFFLKGKNLMVLYFVNNVIWPYSGW